MISITTSDLEAFIASRLAAGTSASEINREVAIIRRAFVLAMRSGLLPTRPHVPTLREDNARQGFFSAEQVADVLKHLPTDVAPAIEFASITGWRFRSEVLTLEWRQIDFESGEVRLLSGHSKNGQARTVVMTSRLRALLAEQADRRDALLRDRGRITPWVFHRAGEPIKSIRKAWSSACRAAGCPGRVIHDLRRSAVRTMVRAGVSQNIVMQMVGHKTASMFRRYDIVGAADLTDAARKLDEALGHSLGTVQAVTAIGK